MDKRGIEHIEVILSFVLFVGLGATAFYYLNPFDVSVDTDTSLEYASNSIIKNSSIEVQKYSAVIDASKIKENSVSVIISREISINMRSKVTSVSGEVLPSVIDNRANGEIKFDWTIAKGKLIYIYLGEDFSVGAQNPITPLQKNGNDAYSISSFYQRKVVSEKRLEALAGQYTSNYESVKSFFGLPAGKDFGFTMNNIKAEKKIPKEINAFIKGERKETLLKNEQFGFQEIRVRIW